MLKKSNINCEIYNNITQIKKKPVIIDTVRWVLSSYILHDMMMMLKMWRQIKGYNSNGQRSHSNNKSNKKNKMLLNYRVQQFYQMFGKKKRDIFSSIVIAEYNNKLWMSMWYSKWLEARLFVLTLALKGSGKVKFDPQLLSKNIITGVRQERKKKKHNAAKKKMVLVATIGLPFLFSYYLFTGVRDKIVPFKLIIPNESRRKMGKKKKKK